MVNPAILGGLVASIPKKVGGEDRWDAPKCDYGDCEKYATHVLVKLDGAFRYFCTKHFNQLRDKPEWIYDEEIDERWRKDYFNLQED